MTSHQPPASPVESLQLAHWLFERRDIWQMDLMGAAEFAGYASERGVRFTGENVLLLWDIGLLRADLVRSTRKVRRAGLIALGSDSRGRQFYADTRRARRRRRGWVDAGASAPPVRKDIEPLFHPFRLYALFCIRLVIQVNISPMQLLQGIGSYPRLLNLVTDHFTRWSASSDFAERVDAWNDSVALAVVAEPWVYEEIFGTVRRAPFVDVAIHDARVAQHGHEVAEVYQRASLDYLEAVRRNICTQAERLDRNNDLHTIVRLAKGDARLKLKGNIGGAVSLLAAAEAIRRAAERVFSTKLPEEDERGFGFGMWPAAARERLYGSTRLLDGDNAVEIDFLRWQGLDRGVHTRWYVEGQTEHAALTYALGGEHFTGIDLINLHGEVAQGRGRGVTFRENLRGDKKAHVFSLVSIDGDNSDYLKAVKKSAADDEICGMFFVAHPDFELCNFTLGELEEVLWGIAVEYGATRDQRQELHAAIESVTSASGLLAAATRAVPQLRGQTKGEEWGCRLMRFALEHPTRDDGSERPLFEAMGVAVRGRSFNYRFTAMGYRVDPDTGRPIERPPA